MKKKIALSLCLVIAPTLITLLSNLTPSVISSSLHPFIPSSLNAQIPSNGLVAWYPFNGNANDESGNGNQGTVNGATLTADRFGNANGAYQFDGNSSARIEVPHSEELCFVNTDFTFSAWLKLVDLNATPVGFGGYAIFTKRGVTSGDGYYFLIMGPGNDAPGSNPGAAGYSVSGGGTPQVFSNNIVELDQWQHVAMTYDVNTGFSIFYINGLFAGEASGTYPMVLNSYDFWIGNDVGGQPYNFHGDLDDIALFSRKLSSVEIQQLYQDETGQVQFDFSTNYLFDAPVRDIYTKSDGSMLVAGNFQNVNNVACNKICQINADNSVQSLGSGIENGYYVDEILESQNGLYVGGAFFSNQNGIDLNNVAFWNNQSWLNLSNGFTHSNPNATAIDCFAEFNGSIYAGGDFEYSGNSSMKGVAKWNGQFWESVGIGVGGTNPAYINDMIVFQNELYVTGIFTQISGVSANYIAKFDGTQWHSVGGGLNNWGGRFYIDGQQLIVAGIFTNCGGVNCNRIAGWNGSQWSNFGSGFDDGWVVGIARYNGELYASGDFQNSGGSYMGRIAKWNGTSWEAIGTGFNAPAVDMEVFNGDLWVGGSFTSFNNQNFPYLAKWHTDISSPPLTCNITAPVTSICEGESVTLSVNTTGGSGASSQLPANLQQGLVAYYPFNGNANDESGNGNNGVVNGATLTADRFGNSSSCYTFDGSSYINVANSVSLNNASVSVSGWFNSSEFATNDNEGCKALVGKWWQFPSSCNSNYNAHLCVLTKPGAFSTLGSATSFYEGNVFISNSLIDTSTWYFFTFTHDALTGGKIYMNGVLVSQNNIAGSICNSSNPLRIGADTHLGGQLWRFFNGKIDDIAIYNRALSPSEIQQLYTAQSYAWNTGATASSITVTPTTNTTYSCTVTQGSQTCTASVDITVNPNVTNAISATIIEGETYTLGAQSLTSAGTYTEVFASATGCDSTVTLSLNVTSACLPAYVPTNGLVGYWPFCGNANDESGNGNDGVVNGATLTSDRNGDANSAYSFFGGTNVSVPFNPNQNIVSEGTWLAWVEVSSFPNVGTTAQLISKYNSNLNQRSYVLELELSKFKHNVNDGVVWHSTTSSNSIIANEWIQVAVVFDNSKSPSLEMYINGVLSDSDDSYHGDLPVYNLPIVFGNNIGIALSDFDGKMDDIGIWNRALSFSEIQQLYQDQTGQVQQPLTCNITAPVTSICEGESITLSVNTTGGAGASSQLPANLQQGLVAYYPFNGNANDESGNGNHGTVNGATLTSDRFGSSGSAFNFGSDYIEVLASESLNNQQGTINFWMRTSNQNLMVPIKKNGFNGASNEQYSFAINYQDLFSVKYNSNCIPGIGWEKTGGNNSSLTDGSWHLVSATYSNTLDVYLDGVLISSLSTPSAGADNCSGDLQIGREWSNFPNYYYGDLDDIAIYNRALSPTEIQQLYTTQSFAWNTGATTNSITITPNTNTTYSCTVTQGSQTCTASVDITVNPNVTNAISASIIEGETYTLGAQTLTTAGTYTEVFTSPTGCDSTVTLTLSVEPLLTCNISAPVTTICEGESVTLSVNTTGGAGASSQLPANLQQGLVAYYPFSGNANDESGNGNNGTVNGATLTEDRFGNANGSYSFDGVSDFILVLDNPSIKPSNSISLSAWVFIDSNEQSNFNGILNKSHWQSQNYASYQLITGNAGYNQTGNTGFTLRTDFSYNWTGANGTQTQAAGNNILNQWQFVCGTWDGVNMSFYQNDNLAAVVSQGGDIVYNSESLLIGKRKDGNGFDDYFMGKIDDIAIYNRALSPSEIQQLYTSQSFTWNTGATTPTITVSPTETTTYTATVTTATQTCTDSITITVNPLLDWYADADGDGFGNADNVVQDCNQPAGFVADNTDCNDEDAITYPGAEEICDNNRDDNCDGQIDENCTILGCTDPSACNFDPLANTDDNSCILPQPEICDGLDNNCNNQIDEGLSPASINAVAATTALYPVCSGNSIKSANLNNGANSAVIDGSGNDLWYSFTAQYNTFRAGLSAASGDNDVRIYTMSNGGCLELIETEHETTNGNQTLLTDQLTVGQTYYVAVHNISGPMNASAKICFNHLNASSCDHYYSNNTGIYTSVCNSFKAQYRANAVAYTFEILSATQNGVNQNITPWSYTTPSASTVVARLGTLLPANQGTSPIVYTMQVPVLYSLWDAAGNFENLYAQATSTCTTTLNAEPTIALRSSDRCPTNKSITSTIAPDRTVCGAMRYDWEFTEVLPAAGTAQVVQGGAYASAFFLSNIPGVSIGKTYNVRVRPVHSSGTTGNWGSTQCLRIGNAGMILENHPVQTAQALVRTPLLSLRAGGEMNARYSIYPNPTATGSFVLQYNGSRRGELIFAQEPTTTESTFAQQPTTTESTSAQEPTTTESNSAQEPSTTESTFAQEPTTTESNSAQEPSTTESTQELVMLDITGKVVFKTNVVVDRNPVEIKFGDLASGVYVVMVGEERVRLVVE